MTLSNAPDGFASPELNTANRLNMLRANIEGGPGGIVARVEQIAQNPAAVLERFRAHERNGLTRLNALRTVNQTRLQGVEQLVEQAVAGNTLAERNTSRLGTIIQSLQEEAPAVGEAGPRNRYVYKQRIQVQGAEEPIYEYKVDMNAIMGSQTGSVMGDIGYIDQLIPSIQNNPAAVTALQNVRTSLLQMTYMDPISQEYHARESERAQRPAAQALGQMGRLATFSALGAWTILAGAVGRSPMAAMAGAGGMMLVANPGVLRPADQRRMEASNSITTNQTFQQLLQMYRIGGISWEPVSETLSTMPNTRFTQLQSKLNAGQLDQEFLDDVGAAGIGATVRRMMTDMVVMRAAGQTNVTSQPALLAFASFLRASRDTDVRRSVVDHIRERRS